jgi:hypothetical protein
MGEIKKVLAMDEIEPRSVTADRIWTDLCENVHLHYRNLRLDFSETEFATFRAAMHNLGMAVEMCAIEKDYEEGDPNVLIQQMFDMMLKTDSEYYTNRATIELQRNNTVHFHYRDLRIHWSYTEFLQIAKMFATAVSELEKLKPFPYKVEKATRINKIPIDLIQPYDAGHLPLAIDDEHIEGVEYVKKLMEEGAKIRPILVNCEGQRLDGLSDIWRMSNLAKKPLTV